MGFAKGQSVLYSAVVIGRPITRDVRSLNARGPVLTNAQRRRVLPPRTSSTVSIRRLDLVEGGVNVRVVTCNAGLDPGHLATEAIGRAIAQSRR